MRRAQSLPTDLRPFRRFFAFAAAALLELEALILENFGGEDRAPKPLLTLIDKSFLTILSEVVVALLYFGIALANPRLHVESFDPRAAISRAPPGCRWRRAQTCGMLRILFGPLIDLKSLTRANRIGRLRGLAAIIRNADRLGPALAKRACRLKPRFRILIGAPSATPIPPAPIFAPALADSS